ncbi:hypothetical protein LJR074_001976 [Acidovorax sp. LjRoot74]|uniref:hypothetical protein n=1 Tax=Acidovorax sp. LjRoot74 TaxID=3342337 RepID=UPI003ECDC953
MKNILQYLQAASVPVEHERDAVDSLLEAQERAHGLTWTKWKVRLLHAGKIAKLLPWHAERLIEVRPDLADWDIAPMVNITAQGDNVPWPNGRPAPGAWMDDTPEARAANYWCQGAHPRSTESRKAWYRRNAGEYRAWRLGHRVTPGATRVWSANGVTVRENNGAWQIVAQDKWLGLVPVRVRIGYEIDNVVRDDGTQLWYPIPGHDLRAPVTWSTIPFR